MSNIKADLMMAPVLFEGRITTDLLDKTSLPHTKYCIGSIEQGKPIHLFKPNIKLLGFIPIIDASEYAALLSSGVIANNATAIFETLTDYYFVRREGRARPRK